MVRGSAAFVAFVGACGPAGPAEPAPASAARPQVVAEVRAELAGKKHEIVVAAEDRACANDGDCAAILTQCGMCEGACTGVRTDRASRYADHLDCAGYRGEVCNYDCRPEFGIEAPRCVAGRCESVRIGGAAATGDMDRADSPVKPWWCVCYSREAPGGPEVVTACRSAEKECQAIAYAATCGLTPAIAGSLTHACRAVDAAHPADVYGARDAWRPSLRGWTRPGACPLEGPATRHPARCSDVLAVNKGPSIDITLGERIGGLRLGMKSDVVVRRLGEPPIRGTVEPFWAHGGRRQTWQYPDLGLTLEMVSLYRRAPEKVRALTIVAPSTRTTTAGVGLGSSRADVIDRYEDRRELEFSTPDDERREFIAGSYLGGLLFRFEDDRVVEMFLGDATE